jgi:site-specific DNA recombinase
MEQNKVVGIWIRVSTDDQAKGESPEHHEKRARLYAESKGWEVKTVYHLEALTGKSVMGYAETQRMLTDIKAGAITGLIFSKLARFARNTKELLEFADIFREEDAALISLEEAIDTSTPAGRLFYTMIAAMAQWEREEIVSRIVASIPIRAQEGKHMGGKPSLGYKWESTGGRAKELIIDEEYAPVRKLLYELFLKHKRKRTVAKMLNEQGYRTRTGSKFTDTTVARLLRDPMAKGVRIAGKTDSMGGKKNYTLRPTEEWHLHACPAIITENLWNECNAVLDKLEKKRTRVGPKLKRCLPDT